MAVSLSQYSKEIARRRSIAYHQENAAVIIPMPEHFQQHTYQHPYFQQTYPPPPPPPPPPSAQQYEYDKTQFYNNTIQFVQPPPYHHNYVQPTKEDLPPPPPPPPSKTPLDDKPPQLPQRPDSTPTLKPPPPSHSSPTPSSTSINPDPLPPHSNPQALTMTQSLAYTNSSPIPPLRLAPKEIYSTQTGYSSHIIIRSTPSGLPSWLTTGTKSLLTLQRTDTGLPIGTIRFHSITSTSIDLTINGRGTELSPSMVSDKWSFLSTTTGEQWYWKPDNSSGGSKLENRKGKGGQTLARIKGNLLVFEQGRLSEAICDEILISAVAMAGYKKEEKEALEVLDVVGSLS